MIGVLEISAAVEILLKGKHAHDFREVIRNYDAVLAPDLFSSELANTFWKYHQFRGLSVDKSLSCCKLGLALVDQFVDTREVWREALHEAMSNNHPVYDLVYVICARRNSATLVTMDRKLMTLAQHLGVSNFEVPD